MADTGEWKEWSQYVKMGMSDLKEKIDKLQEKVEKLNLEIAVIKMKVALWGGLGAAIVTGAWQIIMTVLKKGP